MNVLQQSQKRIPYDISDCGGPQIHGTAECVVQLSIDPSGVAKSETNDCKCKVTSRPNRNNYALWYALAQAMESVENPPHLFAKGEIGVRKAWESVGKIFFARPEISQYTRPQSKTLSEQWEVYSLCCKLCLYHF